MTIQILVPRAYDFLLQSARYKVAYGGRGGSKSWSFARVLLKLAREKKLRIGCFREFQSSIADSVHTVLRDNIIKLGMQIDFDITDKAITSRVGSEFIFKGLYRNLEGIKSLEGINIAWVEEAQSTANDSWRTVIPTIRNPGPGMDQSEIWVSYNPIEEEAPTHQRFVINPPHNAIVRKINYDSNPFFPPELEEERKYLLSIDPEAYANVYEGECMIIGDALIFKGRYIVEDFEAPEGTRFYFGVDWGFANDPTVLIRQYITQEPDGEHLWIDYEAFGYKTELDDIPALFERVPDSNRWPLKADSSRPETISYIRRKGFNISAAQKWPGSVEDGIAHLKSFRKIHVHDRCKRVQQEFRLYSFKVDRLTGQILPVIVDKHNHGIDASRYGLDGLIQARGGIGVWQKMAHNMGINLPRQGA